MSVELKKKIVIDIDMIDGKIDFLNEDELSYVEIMGALEYVKMMVIRDWME